MTREESAHVAYHIPGWMWPSELGWLWDTFGASKLHAEVGLYCGKSLWMTAMGMWGNNGLGKRIIAVDPLCGFACGIKWEECVLNATLDLIRDRSGVRVDWWRVTSLEAMDRVKTEGLKFDSVFIDTDHHYAETKAAIEGWLPLIRPGGIIAGHDYWHVHSGVMDAVNESLGDRFQVAKETRIWYAEV